MARHVLCMVLWRSYQVLITNSCDCGQCFDLHLLSPSTSNRIGVHYSYEYSEQSSWMIDEANEQAQQVACVRYSEVQLHVGDTL